jgi:hypothetical protein
MQAEAIELPQSWDNLAWCYVHHGNAARAARESGFSEKGDAQRGYFLLTKPQVVTRCFFHVAGLRAAGQPPLPQVVRRLIDVARARLLPGKVAACDLAHLPAMVKEGVEFLKAHDIVVHPRCRHLIDELALYSYRTDPKTGEILAELEDRENHAVDALRYAVEGQRHSTYDSSMKWVR